VLGWSSEKQEEKNVRNHTKLRAFELADELVIMIYRATKSFPKEEVY
jgi:hypothetical protein